MNNWQSVYQRLPQKNDLVIVYTKHQEMKICTFKKDDSGYTFWIHNTTWPCTDVKYWILIPELPE